MNEYIKLEAILSALRSARDTIGTLDRPAHKHGYEDFATRELREMFYAINDWCITLRSMQETLEENGEG